MTASLSAHAPTEVPPKAMAKASPYTTPPSVLAQIANLAQLPMADIKTLWKSLFGEDAPTHNRQFLERRIAYRLQEMAFSKIDRGMIERNLRRIHSILNSGKNPKRDRDIRMMPGTLLAREYQGRHYQVAATADGQYAFEGRIYQSLSRIAKEITGTAWSGPVFFGLKSSAVKKAAGKTGARK